MHATDGIYGLQSQPQEFSLKRRSRSAGNLTKESRSASEKIGRKVPMIPLDTIRESKELQESSGSREDTLTVKTPRSARGHIEIKVVPYSVSECRHDCRGDGKWEVTNKSFPEATIKEIRKILDRQKMQEEALETAVIKISCLATDLEECQEAHLKTEEILKLMNFKINKITEVFELALNSNKDELRLVSCQLSKPLMEAVIGKNLKILHLEQTVLEKEVCAGIGKALKREDCSLESLQMASVNINPESLAIIFDGIKHRNEFPTGIKNMCLVACRINEKFDQILEDLIGQSIHLVTLNLETNELGSACRLRKNALNLVAKQAEKKPERVSPRQTVMPEPLNYSISNYPNSSLVALLNGAIENQENNGKLNLIILSDNQLTNEDRTLLDSEAAKLKSPTIQFNVSKNGLAQPIKNRRLLYHSPRPISSQPTDRIQANQKRRSSLFKVKPLDFGKLEGREEK